MSVFRLFRVYVSGRAFCQAVNERGSVLCSDKLSVWISVFVHQLPVCALEIVIRALQKLRSFILYLTAFAGMLQMQLPRTPLQMQIEPCTLFVSFECCRVCLLFNYSICVLAC